MFPSTLPVRRLQVHGFSGFRGFSDILGRNDVLMPSQKYTFTFVFPWYSQYPSDSDAIQFLNQSLGGAAQVISSSRALFSSNYVVTIIPSVSLTVDEFISAFSDAWKGAPWYVAEPTFVQVEGGVVSSQPGGLVELASSVTGGTAEAAAAAAKAAIKPLLPYILIGGGILALITFGPQLVKGRMLS